MKTTKKMIMGIAAVMAVSALGISSVSAQGNIPQQAGKIDASKASEAITINFEKESDKYTVITVPEMDGEISEADASEAIAIDFEKENDKYTVITLPEMDGEISEADASEAITIDFEKESDKYTVIGAGSASVSADGAITLSEKDKTVK